ncbi:unnamed protein product [Alopecurus aequalis]
MPQMESVLQTMVHAARVSSLSPLSHLPAQKEMEVKKWRVATIGALCMLLMLSGQQQKVAAMSKFCRCYKHKQCYPRHKLPPIICFPFCTNKCSPNQADDGAAAISCMTACGLDSISSFSAVPGADAEACVRDCNQKQSHD